MAILRWCSVIFTRLVMHRPFWSCVVPDATGGCNGRASRRAARAIAPRPGPGLFFPDHAPHGRRGVLPRHHARCSPASAIVQDPPRPGRARPVLAFAWAASLTFLAIAQPPGPVQTAQPDRPAAAAPSEQGDAAPPAPARAMEVWAIVDGWVRAGEVPAPDAQSTPGGGAVTLRLAGQIVGRGADTDSLARAAIAAITEAGQRMPIEKDALREEAAAEARQRLCISLELSGALVPYAPRLYDQADLELQAGLDGVAARRADRVEAVFPATMLANNLGPGDGLATAIAQVTGDPTLAIRAAADTQPAAVAAKHGLALYRFRTTHLAQTGPGRPPTFLFRGGKVVRDPDINAPMLREFADGLARHLVARKWGGEGPMGLLGTFWPAQGRYEPLVAGPFERALVAVALQRYVEHLADGPGAEARSSAEGLIERLLASLEASHLERRDISPATAALCDAVIRARARSGGPAGCSPEFASYVAEALDGAAERLDAVAPGERAIVAWAMSRRAEASREPGDIAAAEGLVRGVFIDTPPAQLPAQMPWLGWAELALTAARGDGIVSAGPALREMRDELWRRQLTATDCGDDAPDLVGGIAFTGSTGPLPTAACLRPMAFASTMLGDPALTSDPELPKQLAQVLAGLRFARQLAADESTGFMYQDPSRARWGIRNSLWDQRQAPESSAVALLLLVETLEALEARGGRARADAPAPSDRTPKSP